MIELQVEGMSCTHCISKVTRAIRELDVHAKVDVDLKSRTVRIESPADLTEIKSAVSDAGYAVVHATA